MIGRGCYEQPGPPVTPIKDGRATPQPLRKEGMAMTIVEAAPGITGGVDTHLDKHVATALDPLGSAGRHRVVQCRRRWLQSPAGLARGVRPGDQGWRRGNRFLWRRTLPVLAEEGHRGHRSQPTQPAVPTQPGQVRPPRCDRGRPGRHQRSGIRCGQDQGRSRRGHPGSGGGQALCPTGPGKGHRPDAPSGNHRP